MSLKFLGNPANIRFSRKNSWLGEMAPSRGFCQFRSNVYGVRALIIILNNYLSYHKLRTVSQVIDRFAPREDGNNTYAYARYVASELGVAPNSDISDALSGRDIDKLFTLCRAICYFESSYLLDKILFRSALSLIDREHIACRIGDEFCV